MEEELMSKFYTDVKSKIKFYIASKIWDRPNRLSKLDGWYSNFDTPIEKYFASKILDKFIYYSYEDIIELCKYGIFQNVVKNKLIKKLELDIFIIENKQYELEFKKQLSNIAFIPLADSGRPPESSNLIAQILRDELNIQEDHIFFPADIEVVIKSHKFSHILIFDDIIGSGDQIYNFWNTIEFPFAGQNLTFRKISENNPTIDFEYLSLVATQYGLENLNEPTFNVNGLKISFVEQLTDEYRIFNKKSIFFNEEEAKTAKLVLENLCNVKGIKFKGHENLDYAVSFSHGTPDCSLPMFKVETPTWNGLF